MDWLSPDGSCLAKTTTGLEVTMAPDSPLRKEMLGLDIAVDNLTIKKSLMGLQGGYVVETPDIAVSGNMIICNITAGSGLVKTASGISLAQLELDKLDEIPKDFTDKMKDLDNLKITAGQ
ncbi:hypothetical protein HDV00_000875 [Rhizophlyctis rosea]|nr:hypothetical protein HDV00_000875 [Rhizophlyctis rosea]